MTEWNLKTWTGEDYRAFQRELIELSDEGYRKFNARIVPDESRRMYGVRVPEMRKLAKSIARGNFRSFLSVSDGESHEEITVEGLVIGLSKMPVPEREEYFKGFAEKITNWAICDIAVSGEKGETPIETIVAYTKSEKPFVVRFGLVRLLAGYLFEEHIRRVLEVAKGICRPEYYVRMANAWLISVCYVKFPELTAPILESLDAETRKMAAQKIRDSRRVPAKDKQSL